ncbi:MAG: VOC family protein [Muribaculaceae bacterium]|jgi:glyoxylase I family protein|nr:VOC family protein [Muribaculaceae bacterium]
MLQLNKVHHIALICSDYQKSLEFYTRVVGCQVIAEHWREEQQSYLTKLSLNGEYVIELFSYPSPPQRPSYPEAAGLRHLAFEVDDIEEQVAELDRLGVAHEAIRTDMTTGKHFVFFNDPDDQPLEMYEK